MMVMMAVVVMVVVMTIMHTICLCAHNVYPQIAKYRFSGGDEDIWPTMEPP